MSVQTGVLPPTGPASRRLKDRARFRLTAMISAPNPIWVREMKQAARLVRSPVILAVLTILMTLLMASIGGIMASTSSPAETGSALFHTYFSVAYFVVTLVGPAVAANAIASEREGHTWEAVLLTGMRPSSIAQGKFFAATTAIGMYIVMLAPVGAIPFLFGGVTAAQVIIAFLFLFIFGALGVGFGLVISSKLQSLRTALVVTLLLAFMISVTGYGFLGVGLSFAANSVWPAIPGGSPVWLPTAYDRAPFGVEYVVFLIAIPIATVTLLAWFLYEATIANLSAATDDQSTGLKRWFLATAPVVTVAAVLPVLAGHSASNRVALFLVSGCLLVVFNAFIVFLFQGEPLGPSRRVRAAWEASSASRFQRFLGPSVANTVALLVIVLSAILAVHAAATTLILTAHSGSMTEPLEVVTFTSYALGVTILMAGLGALTRARAATPFMARIVLAGLLFGIAIGPWIVAAIGGVVTDGRASSALMIAAPSPFYVFVMLDELKSGTKPELVQVGFACALGWAVVGLVAAGFARRRCHAAVAKHLAILAEADRWLAEEDALAANPQAEPADADASAGAARGSDA
jgi:ABC-type transport system involved in multi-copper enzyme maturation permease subunit